MECARELELREHNKNVIIYSDSQAALKALNRPCTTSALVKECKLSLNRLSQKRRITIAWTPGHQGIEGNEIADELARKGADENFYGPEPSLPIPGSVTKRIISLKIRQEANTRWTSQQTCRQAKIFIKNYDNKRTKELLSLNKKQIRIVIGMVTGHCELNRHLTIMKIKDDPSCPECDEEETSYHFLAECPEYSLPRWEILGNDRLSEEDLKNVPFLNIIRFHKATHRIEGH